MEIMNWLGNLFKDGGLVEPELPKVEEKSHEEIPLAYVNGNTFGTWRNSGINSPYTQNGTIRRSIDIMAFNLAQLPFNTSLKGVKQPELIVDPNNVDISSILMSPNEITSGFKFKLTHWSYYLLYDKVYWLLNRNPFGIIKEIYTLNPRMVVEKKDKFGEILFYEYGGKLKLNKEDVVDFSGFNPINPTGSGGSSILDTLNIELKTEYAASKFGNKFFENGTRVSGVITGTENATLDQMQKVLAQWMQAHQGSDNAYKVGALLGGMKYEERGMSMRDAEFINGRKEIKDRIIEAYGIPKSVYGLVDKIDRATADTQMRQFWQVTLKPLALLMQEDINTLLLKKNYPDYTVKYDFSVVEELKKDVNETVEAARKYFELGYTRNEVNKRFRLGMDEDDTGNTRYIPTSIMEEGIDTEPEVLVEETPPKKEVSIIIEKEIKVSEDVFRKRFLKELFNQEKLYNSKIRKYIFNYRKEVLGVLNGKKAQIEIEPIINDLNRLQEQQDKKLKSTILPLYVGTVIATKTNIYNLLGVESEVTVDSKLIDTFSKRITGVNKTINNKIISEIKSGLDAGETLDQLTERVKNVYNFSTSRAKMIARTESTNIMNATAFATYKEVGIKKKRWVDAGDDDVRDSHRKNTNQGPIPMNKSFSNGSMYPDEPNCRCTVVPYIEN